MCDVGQSVNLLMSAETFLNFEIERPCALLHCAKLRALPWLRQAGKARCPEYSVESSYSIDSACLQGAHFERNSDYLENHARPLR